MVSEAALARKKRFLQAKEEAGGAENLVKTDKPWRIFFDDESGVILAATQDPDFRGKPDWVTYPFEQDELKILGLGKERTRYRSFRVVRDEEKIGVRTIQMVTPGETSVAADKSFLYEIEYLSKKQLKETSIICEVKGLKNGNVLDVTASDAAKDDIRKMPSSTAISRFRIFITARHNPHLLYHVVSVDIAELMNKKIRFKLPTSVPEDFSLYTMKVFMGYGRK